MPDSLPQTEPPAFAALQAQTELRFLRAPWAPGLVLAFARWRGDLPALSDLAAGAGGTAPAARRRALGELVENLSIGAGAHGAPVPARDLAGQVLLEDARALPEAGADNLGSEGCAAGPDAQTARLAALCEAAERAALALWWQGRLRAQRVAPPPEVALWRAGGMVARRCRVFALPLLAGLAVRLVVCDDGQGGQPVFGSAAHPDPQKASRAALREAMQAELAWLMPPDHPDLPERDLRAEGLRLRAATLEGALEGAGAAEQAVPPADLAGLLRAMAAQGLRAGFADLTHPALGVPVFRCVCPDWPRARPLFQGG